MRGIQSSGLPINQISSPPAERKELALVHEPAYVEMVEAFCQLGGGALDMDTFVSDQSWEAALTAAGGVLALIEELSERSDAVGFAPTRPPGHHALANRAMGFCLFNNVAVAAARLRAEGDRVAILDWDVHHGNGTQEMMRDDPGTLYVSIHQEHFYPLTGHIDDIDVGQAKGTVINVPLPAGTAGDVYRRAWDDLVLPVLTQFEPDWVLVSAGFDAHLDDELASLSLESDDYGWMAHRLAAAHPVNRTVFALEGGYDLAALHDSTQAVLLGLNGAAPTTEARLQSPPQSTTALGEAAIAISRHWKV
jgi:acetoin utilization deacetylase AcuC-like enzyme